MENTKSALVRALNDRLRQTGMGGRLVATSGVAMLGTEFLLDAMSQLARFDRFTEDGDPYGEHDFGAFELRGFKLLWKIDYYDALLKFGADDASSETQCVRVLTLMLAEEY